jgi:flagellar motor switch protein FliN
VDDVSSKEPGAERPTAHEAQVHELVAEALAAPHADEFELEELVELPHDGGDGPDVGLLLGVPLEVSVELGRTRVTIADLLELGQGSILRLDRHAGEPVDVLVNGRILARGEVVVIDEDFGVRVTHVVPQS